MKDKGPNLIIGFDHNIIKHFNETRKWAFFLSILELIFMLILIIFGFSFGYILKLLGQESVLPGSTSLFLGFMYLVIALLYFFPILFLLRFSIYAKKSIQNKDNSSLVTAFKNLKYHYAYIGIVTAIGIGLYVFMGIIIGIVAILT